MTRPGRSTALLIAICALQAAALFISAKSAGARVPYMAIKMAYLVIYPLAAGGALALALAWQGGAKLARVERASTRLAWACTLLAVTVLGWRVAETRRQPPTVSEDLFRAGQWARANLEPECVDYVVKDDNTAYWLHLAVLGNRRMSPRTADDSTFITKDAIVRWINPGGLPYAIVDLGTIPRDVVANTDELVRFDTASVVRRRGEAVCEIKN
jgi:hypothetical protein